MHGLAFPIHVLVVTFSQSTEELCGAYWLMLIFAGSIKTR